MITIIEGCGSNINSLLFALERLGIKAKLSSDVKEIQAAEKIILPGVGHAANAMRSLKEKNLTNVIRELQQPVLGICLGMQLLFEYSEEGNTECLNIIPGTIKKIPSDQGQIVPHMGWNQLLTQQKNPLISRADNNRYVYFVHSYAAPINEFTLAATDYNGLFASLVQNKNFYGAQFHPEKSGRFGEEILNNFARINL